MPTCSAPFDAVAIGTSAGGVELLLRIIPALPADFPAPIIICQHAAAGATIGLARLLDSKSKLAVSEAQEKTRPSAGRVYLAPGGYHLLIERDGQFSLSLDPPVNYARPSIDVLMLSAADAYGSALAGILLTGANHDGAAGIAGIRLAGGLAVVQDPGTAQVPTMPEAALRLTTPDLILPLAQIHALLLKLGLNAP
jgi:two-component system chemotaxis response regulator CheB